MTTSGKSGGKGEQTGSGTGGSGGTGGTGGTGTGAQPKAEAKKSPSSGGGNTGAEKMAKPAAPSSVPPSGTPRPGAGASDRPAAGNDKAEKAKAASATAGRKPAASGGAAKGGRDEKTPKAEDKPPSAPAKGKSRAGLYAGAALVIFAAGMAAWPVVLPYVAPLLPQQARQRLTLPEARPAIEPQRLAALEETLAMQGRSLKEVRAQLEGLRPLAGRLDALAQRLQALEERSVQGDAGDGAELSALRGEQQALAAKLTALEGRLDALAATPPVGAENTAAGGPGGQPPAALVQSLRDLRRAHEADTARLMQRIDALSAALEAARSNGNLLVRDMAELRRRLDDVAAQARRTGSGSRGAALLIAAGQLADLARRGQPFVQELAVLRELGADPALLEKIGPLAPTGAEARARLLAEVPALADEVVRAARLPQEKGWLGETLKRVGRQISFRKTGEVAGNDAEAIAARAEAAARRGDLRAALNEMETLPEGRAREAAAGWIKRARARLLLDDAVNALIDAALRRLGGGAAAVKEG